jgi:hypothetical protein
MTETKWTPGPWSASWQNDWSHWVVSAPTMPSNTPIVRLSDFDDATRHDAHLIAAAPELYEALAWFINDIDGDRTVMVDFSDNVERARAALSKARGET